MEWQYACKWGISISVASCFGVHEICSHGSLLTHHWRDKCDPNPGELTKESMEFFLAIFFLCFYYIRPQDWFPGLEGVNVVQPIIGIWLIALMLFRSRPSPLPGLLRTPHDWVMLVYLLYIVVFAGASPMAAIPMFSFYFLTVQSLNTWPRLLKYLKAWTWALVVVASFGVAFVFGIDITGADELFVNTLGRLAIGTWIHNNPNSLGHSVVVIIPLAYMLFFWKGTSNSRLMLYPIMALLSFYCAWETQSKGSYVVGGILCLLIITIGKPKKVQIFVVALAFIAGGSALSFLPRMAEMNDLRADEGVQGRLLAWEQAREASKKGPLGAGWNQFIAYIPWQEGNRTEIVEKATHSSYVQVAADLGWLGLTIYLAALWSVGRLVIHGQFEGVTRERTRRALIVLLLSTVLSGWMINREYHTEYFLMIAVAGSMSRLLRKDQEDLASQASPETMADRKGRDFPEVEGDGYSVAARRSEVVGNQAFVWKRFSFRDGAVSVFLTFATFWFWDYLMKNI